MTIDRSIVRSARPTNMMQEIELQRLTPEDQSLPSEHAAEMLRDLDDEEDADDDDVAAGGGGGSRGRSMTRRLKRVWTQPISCRRAVLGALAFGVVVGVVVSLVLSLVFVVALRPSSSGSDSTSTTHSKNRFERLRLPRPTLVAAHRARDIDRIRDGCDEWHRNGIGWIIDIGMADVGIGPSVRTFNVSPSVR